MDADRLSAAVDATPLLGNPTGVGAFCAGLLGALPRRDRLDVSAFAVTWRRRDLLPERLPAGVRAVRTAMPARPLHRAWRRFDLPPVEWFVGDVDVVHGTNFVVPPTRRAARVVTVHDLTMIRYPEICDPGALANLPSLRKAVAEGAWVHTPSRFVAEEVVTELGASPQRVHAVPHGIPALAESVTDDIVPDGAPYVLAVGTIEPRKDLTLLVEAFNTIAAADHDLRLVLAGPPGWGADDVAVSIAASPFESRILRTGYLSDGQLAGLLRNAAVLAYPSRYEGFGLPPLQAMDVGVPVVATAVGAIPEVVGDGACLVPTGDVDALGAGLRRVLHDDGERKELVARGHRRASAFSWDACAAGIAEIYRMAAASMQRRL